MRVFFVLMFFSVFLFGCTIPFTDITLFEEPVTPKECSLVPCVEAQTIQSDLSDVELLPEAIVGTNKASLRTPDKCELSEGSGIFVDCFTEKENQLVSFKENYAAIVPTDLSLDENSVAKLNCFVSQQGLLKTSFLQSDLSLENDLSKACFNRAPVDWCCGFVEVITTDVNST